MTTPLEIRPSRDFVRSRMTELLAADPVAAERAERLRRYSHGIRTSEVFLTSTCNLRCQGCWYFDHDLDKGVHEIHDPGEQQALARQLADSGVTYALLIGGEPTLVPQRVAAIVREIPNVAIATNGLRRLPFDGFEDVAVMVSVFGGGPEDDRLRAIRPNGSHFTGLFETGLANYREDPRVCWNFALSEPGIAHVYDTVSRIADNGNQVLLGFYSSYGQDDPTGLTEGRKLLDEALRVRDLFPDVVVSHPYYLETLITGRSHWARFGYDVCATISTSHPAHAERLRNGHPVLPGFNAYRADHTLEFCCTSGDCDGCRDSQAVLTWLMVNGHHFLDSPQQLLTWIEVCESFYAQYRWSPYHASRRTP